MQVKSKSLPWLVISRVLGIAIFLAVVALLSILTHYVDAPFFGDIVEFILSNTVLIVFIALLFLISDLFTAFAFPLNLPAPFFTATAGIFLVAFLFQIFKFVGSLYSLSFFGTLDVVELIIYPILFLAILVVGYLQILHQLTKGEEHQREREGAPVMHKGPGEKSWDDIGMEFRQMVYDILHRIREDINRR